MDETRRFETWSTNKHGQSIWRKGDRGKGAQQQRLSISLLTCNNTASCSRDPCIVSRSMGSRSKKGEKEKERALRWGPEGRGVYGSILIIVPVIPERSRRVNDFCISPDRSLSSIFDRASLLLSTWIGAQPSTESFLR